MHSDSTYVGIVVTLIIVLVFLGAISLVFWAARRVSRRFFWTAAKPSRMAARPGTTPAWIWLALILGFTWTFWHFVPKAAKRDRPQPAGATSSYTPLLLAGGVVALAGAFLAYCFIRAYDFGVRRAQNRASAGDINGAIADLREQIDDKGPTQQRVNALGVLLTRCDRWDEAAESFRKAAELDGPKGMCWSNLGLALLKGGKPEEAVRVLRDAAQIGPQVPALLCMVGLHTSQALAALGRWDEADEKFRGATAAARGLSRSQRDVFEREIAQFRLELAERSHAAKKIERLDEP